MSPSEVLWTAPSAGGPLDAIVPVTGSKSLTSRHLVLAAQARGPSLLRGALASRDTRLFEDALSRLGARLRLRPGDTDVAPLDRTADRPASLSGQGSGTLLRYLPPLAALTRRETVLTDSTGAAGPRHGLAPLVSGLRDLGVDVEATDGFAPLTIRGAGRIGGGEIEIDGSVSSQILTGLLLAAPSAEEAIVIREARGTTTSRAHVGLTLSALRDWGVDAQDLTGADGRGVWRVEPVPLDGRDQGIELDISCAAPFLAAALVAGGTVVVPDWPPRTRQPADLVRTLLERAGGVLDLVGDSPPGLRVRGTGVVEGFRIALDEAEELVPVALALALVAETPSRIERLMVTGADGTQRIAVLLQQARSLGADVELDGDDLVVTPVPLRGGRFDTAFDHRIAHHAALLGLRLPGLAVTDIQSTRKSLPDFEAMWLSLLSDRPAGRVR